MSLEVAIQENTAAIKELIATISKGLPVSSGTAAAISVVAGASTEEIKAAAREIEKKAAAKKQGAASQSTGTTSESPASGAPSGTGESANTEGAGEKALTYEDIKAPFLKLYNDKGRDVAAKLLADFKHKDDANKPAGKLPDVAPADYPAVLAAINKAYETAEA